MVRSELNKEAWGSRQPDGPHRVLHVINSLGISGGAEQQLVANLSHFSDSRLQHLVSFLYEYAFESRGPEVSGLTEGVFPLYNASEHRRSRLATLHRLDRVIRVVAPDLLHCTLADACLATRILGWWHKIPVVESLVNISHEQIRTLDNPNVTGWKLWANRLIDRLTMRAVTRFHALSDVVARSWVETIGIPESKIRVIPRGVDIDRLEHKAAEGPSRGELLKSLGLGAGSLIVLNVGRHEPQKGQRYLIEAMSEVLKAMPEAVLLIVGREGNSTERLEKAVKDLGISKAVRLLGRSRDVAALMQAADVFVFPSLFEGLGVSLLEAMALGVPIVTTDIAPMNEVCEHGRGGLLCESRNSAELARRILQVFEDPTGAANRCQRARDRIEELFRIERTSADVERMYIELLGLQ